MKPLPFLIWHLLALALAAAACDGIHDASAPGNLVPKTVDEDPALPSLALAGTKFHFETEGDPSKPVIIFLHGGPGGDYRLFTRLRGRYDGYALADDHYLVFWDQRGSGLSRRENCSAYTLDGVDRDLDQLVDHVSPGRPVTFIGESWGGMYATEYINRHPEKVAAAVLVEPGPLNATFMNSVKDQLVDFDVFAEWLNDYAWDSQFLSPDDHARADYQMVVAMRDSQPRFHQSTVDPEPIWRLGAVAATCVQNLGMTDGKPTYDFTNHLGAYSSHVLFIASDQNEVIGAAFQDRQRAVYPSSELVVTPNTGHDLLWTNPAEALAAIHSYLTAVVQ
jgi:proline iminopeptidase